MAGKPYNVTPHSTIYEDNARMVERVKDEMDVTWAEFYVLGAAALAKKNDIDISDLDWEIE